MTTQRSAHEKPFRLEEATIDELHEAIRSGQTTCVASCSTISTAPAPITASPACSSPKTALRSPRRPACVRAGAPLRFPTETVKASTILPISTNTGAAARIRPHGADRVRSVRAAAVRDDRRHAECRPAQRARHPQHPWRTLRDLPRRFRPAPVRGAAAARRAAGLRDVPPAARCARARGRARRDLRAQSRSRARCRCTASSSRSRIRSTPRTCARRPAATRATTSISRRATTCWSSSCATRARSSSPRRSAPNTTAAPAIRAAGTSPTKCLPSTLGYQRSTWAGNPANPYDTTRAASLGSSSGSGVSVSANLVMASLGEETRALPRPGQSQCGGADPAAQVDARLQRRRHRRRHLLRPQRHPLPARSSTAAKVLDALKDPVEGYYDPRDPYTTVPRSSVLSTPLCEPRDDVGCRGLAEGHAHRDHPRVDAASARASRPRSRS